MVKTLLPSSTMWFSVASIWSGAKADSAVGAARSLFPKCVYLRGLRGRRDKAKLLQHRQPIKHQIEREMLAVPKAEHLDVIHFDEAARWRDVPRGTAEHAIVRPGECAFLNRQVIDGVYGFDVDMRIRERTEPAAEERSTGGFSLAVHPAWGFEDHIVGKDFRKSVNVVGVESC
jgi:hypothetical protein